MSSPEKFEKILISDKLKDVEMVDFKEILKDPFPVILDTNFLFIAFQFKIDLISELRRVVAGNCKLYLYQGTITELQTIEDKGEKNKKFLNLISTFIHRYEIKVIKSYETYIDKQMMENVSRDVYIATSDKELRFKLKRAGSKVVFLRQKKYLDID